MDDPEKTPANLPAQRRHTREHDTDRHSMTMLEQAFTWACVLALLFAVGSCIAGGR